MIGTFRKIVKILDGQPTRRRGQSFVELALTAPILLLMIVGMAEIGFLTNDFLIITDAVREAGRKAVNLDPIMSWQTSDDRNFNRMDCDAKPSTFNYFGDSDPVRDRTGNAHPGGWIDVTKLPIYNVSGYHTSTGDSATPGFYDAVACQVLVSMDPLYFDANRFPAAGDTGKDDIVISVVSYVRQDPSTGTTFTSPRMRITGRWPISNRYCNIGGNGDSRDPFDFKRNADNASWHNGYQDPLSGGVPDPDENNAVLLNPVKSQDVRGFVWTGAWKNDDGCYGSQFTVDEIERRLNLTNNPGSMGTSYAGALNNSSPNGGMVIVEVHWQYHPSFFGPLFEGYNGNRSSDPMLNVYGFFPVQSAEPTATP